MSNTPNFDNLPASEEDEEVTFGSSTWGTEDDVLTTPIVVDYGNAPPGEQYHGDVPYRQTGEEILHSFDSLSSDQLYSLQLQLLVTGFDTRKPEKVVWGTPDPLSYRAFARAVTTAARSGKSLYSILNSVPADADALRRLAGGGGAPRVNVVQHMADEDLEAAALRGFQAATGHEATAEQQARFIAEFRKKETAAQPSTAGGGTFNVTDPGNPVNVAEKTARMEEPEDAKAYSRLQKFGVMLQALGVGSGS